jgi:hypothetical protein
MPAAAAAAAASPASPSSWAAWSDGRAGRGIDPDETILGLARQEAAQLGLSAVFRKEGVDDLREEAAYDRVYARFLLTHLAGGDGESQRDRKPAAQAKGDRDPP